LVSVLRALGSWFLRDSGLWQKLTIASYCRTSDTIVLRGAKKIYRCWLNLGVSMAVTVGGTMLDKRDRYWSRMASFAGRAPTRKTVDRKHEHPAAAAANGRGHRTTITNFYVKDAPSPMLLPTQFGTHGRTAAAAAAAPYGSPCLCRQQWQSPLLPSSH
jgi:hypothetical protein